MIKIAICDDMPQIRTMIQRAVEKTEDMTVVSVAATSEEIIKRALEAAPDIILMDIQLETETAGIDATEYIKEKLPDVKIIMLTIHADAKLIIDSYYAGAVDYIVKTDSMDNIVENIRKVYMQSDFLGPLIVKNINKELKKYKVMHESLLFFINGFSTLTNTEKRILKLLYDGHSRKEIEKNFYISLETINTHVKHILKKLEFHSIKELIRFLKDIQLFENFIDNKEQ